VSRHPVDRRLQLQIIFAFIFIYSILLFLTGGQPTRGQVLYRITMMVIGLSGFFTVSRRKIG
jgi:hypothetical protein